MTTITHTPGPWAVTDYNGKTIITARDGEDWCATIDSNGQSSEECEANAWLIAAAPELLSVLRSLVSQYDPDGRWEGVSQVIAKAEGRL